MSKARSVFIFPNGNVAVTDEAGQQMPEYQGGFLDCAYARRLARLIVRDNPEVNGSHFLLNDYLPHYRKYPHLANEEEPSDEHQRSELAARVERLEAHLREFVLAYANIERLDNDGVEVKLFTAWVRGCAALGISANRTDIEAALTASQGVAAAPSGGVGEG